MDHVLEYMKKHGVPLTRDNYLAVAYMGNPPEELDAEEEAALPAQIQKTGMKIRNSSEEPE